MAGGNLSPRQKMIGMMYLVLTALLALNISKEIVLAFIQINKGLEETTSNFNNKNELTYNDFVFQEKQNPGKVKPFHDKAKIIKKLSSDLEKYIETIKVEIMGGADNIPAGAARDTLKLEYCQNNTDNNFPPMIMVGSSADGSTGKARELKTKIVEYKDKVRSLIAQVDPAYAKKMKLGLDVSDPPSEEAGEKSTWEMHNFGHYPLAPVICLLSKLQSDVRNAEADAIMFLYGQVDAKSLKFDVVEAKVIPKSNYVFIGQDYEADVFVAAYSTTQNPEVLVGNVDTAKRAINGNSEPVPVENGIGKYKKKPATEGVQKWGGIINVKMPDGTVQPKPFIAEYIVAKPSATVSPEKMNILYIGLDNPISVSVGGGLSDDKIHVVIAGGGGTIAGSKGKYIARVTEVTKPGQEAIIRVSAELEKGKSQAMGEFKFRVKEVPAPVPVIAGKKGGPITKAILSVQSGIVAALENFQFDSVRFVVTSYDAFFAYKGKDGLPIDGVKGASFSKNVQDAIAKVRPMDQIFFTNIKAVGPGGKTKDIGSLSFKIN